MTFAIFDLQVTPILLQSFESTGHTIKEKKRKTVFQDGGHEGHLVFPIELILATFDLQIAPILPIKFQVNLTFRSGRRRK